MSGIKKTCQSIAWGLNEISPQQRKVYELTRIAGLTLPETAAQMGVSRHTAKEHLVRALKLIQREKHGGHIELVVLAAIPLFPLKKYFSLYGPPPGEGQAFNYL